MKKVKDDTAVDGEPVDGNGEPMKGKGKRAKKDPFPHATPEMALAAQSNLLQSFIQGVNADALAGQAGKEAQSRESKQLADKSFRAAKALFEKMAGKKFKKRGLTKFERGFKRLGL